MKLLLILVFSSVACFGQTRMLQGTRLANTFGAVITNLTLPNLPITNMLRINAEGAVTNVLIGANMAFDGTTLSSTASGGGGTVGTVINTGASVVSNVPRYTDTTGTNVAPSSVKIDASGNISVVNSISATTTNVSTIKNLVQTGRITLTDAATIATDASLGNLFYYFAVKGDIFALSAASIGNWSWVYQVACSDNIITDPASNFYPEFAGLNSIMLQWPGTGPDSLIKYVGYAGYDGTSAGAGNGNYKLLTYSPAIALRPDWKLRFDAQQNYRGLIDPSGAISSATPRKGGMFFAQ